MNKFLYHIVIIVLKLSGLKKIFSGSPINYNKLRKTDVKEVPRKLLKKYKISKNKIAETNITEILNRESNQAAVHILYIPGGAFVSGPGKHHWDALDEFISETNASVWMVDYPKAPEVDIHEMIRNIDEVYDKTIGKFNAFKLILIGDSVGANLILSLVQRLIKKNQRLPDKLILITPVFDSSMTNKEINNIDEIDPVLSKKGVLSGKEMCANGLDLKDPKISPLYGSFKDFPNTTLFIGGRDIMYPDSKIAVDKFKSENIVLELIDEIGMPHIWVLLPILPVAKNARRNIIEIINRCMNID